MENFNLILRVIKLYFIIAIVLLLCNGCEKEDTSPITNSDSDIVNENDNDGDDYEADYIIEPDNNGNLLIKNYTGYKLALVVKGEVVKIVWASADDFLVEIPNPSGGSVELRLHIYDGNNVSSEIFKRWLIPLSPDNSLSSRSTWIVDNATQEINVSTLYASYIGETPYWVEVYLNGRTGSNIISLKSGDQYRSIGLEYGSYTVHYRYIESLQSDSELYSEIGWIETRLIQDHEVPIDLILNQEHNVRYLNVPVWDGGQPPSLGRLRVRNKHHEPIQIWAQNLSSESSSNLGIVLIEEYAYWDGSGVNSSIIAHNEFGNFDLDALEFHLIAKSLHSGVTVSDTIVNIPQDGEQVYWEVMQ